MGALQKLQISRPVYSINTNFLFQVIFEELSFCHFPPLNNSILGEDSQIQLIFHLNILVFQTNGKQPHSFSFLSRFCNGLWDSLCITKVQRDQESASQLKSNDFSPEKESIHENGRGERWGGISGSYKNRPRIRAQVSFSLSHHLGCEQSLPWGRTQKSKRESVTRDCERDVRTTMPRSRAASSAGVGRQFTGSRH